MALATAAALPMTTARLLAAAAMLIAAPRAPMAQTELVVRTERASTTVVMSVTKHGYTTSADAVYRGIVYRAQDALAARRWRDAAQLWESALLENAETGAHWHAYGQALFNSGRYREAIGAYQRGMQIGAGSVDDAVWNVARAYAHLGNRKQAARWVEWALARGGRTYRDVKDEPVFRSIGPLVRRPIEPLITALLAATADLAHT